MKYNHGPRYDPTPEPIITPTTLTDITVDVTSANTLQTRTVTLGTTIGDVSSYTF